MIWTISKLCCCFSDRLSWLVSSVGRWNSVRFLAWTEDALFGTVFWTCTGWTAAGPVNLILTMPRDGAGEVWY
jgi:hypothetical protein